MNPPDGFRSVKAHTWFLELDRNEFLYHKLLPNKYSISKVIPTRNEYLDLYKMVGERWGWANRLIMSDGDLQLHLERNDVYLYHFHYKNEVIGFGEFEILKAEKIEIVYFGLISSYLSKGLGKGLMYELLKEAFNLTSKVCLTTCEYDHPSAMAFYQKIGFHVYNEKEIDAFYPETFLTKGS